MINSDEYLTILDVLRYGGWKIDLGNFVGGERQRTEFMEKFGGEEISSSLRTINYCIKDLILRAETNEQKTQAYMHASQHSARIFDCLYRVIVDNPPTSGSYYISEEICNKVVETNHRNNKEFIVVSDPVTGIADVILPAKAESGGNVTLPGPDRRRYWLTPDEVMLAQDRKAMKARVSVSDGVGYPKHKIAQALATEGKSYVRFYETQGILQYKPEDHYFEGKTVVMSKYEEAEIITTETYDIADAVKHAGVIQFDFIKLYQTDFGDYGLYIKPTSEAPFGVILSEAEASRLTRALTRRDRDLAKTIRQELAQTTYEKVLRNPEEKKTLFDPLPDGVDTKAIRKVSIYRSKDNRMMLCADLVGSPSLSPKEITRQQWLRICISPSEELAANKSILAAHLYVDEIRQLRQLPKMRQPRIAPIKLTKADKINWRLWGTYRKEGEFDNGVAFKKSGRRYLACFSDVKKLAPLYDLEEIDMSTLKGEMVCVEMSERDVRKHLPDLVSRYKSVVVVEKADVKVYGINMTRQQVVGETKTHTLVTVLDRQPRPSLEKEEKKVLQERAANKSPEQGLGNTVCLTKGEDETFMATGIDLVSIYKEFDIELSEMTKADGSIEIIGTMPPEDIDICAQTMIDKVGSITMIDGEDVDVYGKDPFVQAELRRDAFRKINVLTKNIAELAQKQGMEYVGLTEYAGVPGVELRHKDSEGIRIVMSYSAMHSENEDKYVLVATEGEVEVAVSEPFGKKNSNIETALQEISEVVKSYLSTKADKVRMHEVKQHPVRFSAPATLPSEVITAINMREDEYHNTIIFQKLPDRDMYVSICGQAKVLSNQEGLRLRSYRSGDVRIDYVMLTPSALRGTILPSLESKGVPYKVFDDISSDLLAEMNMRL